MTAITEVEYGHTYKERKKCPDVENQEQKHNGGGADKKISLGAWIPLSTSPQGLTGNPRHCISVQIQGSFGTRLLLAWAQMPKRQTPKDQKEVLERKNRKKQKKGLQQSKETKKAWMETVYDLGMSTQRRKGLKKTDKIFIEISRS
ncbi:hypothetical protein LQ236_001356 [Nitrospina gracilis]|uniref:hypothetical protein n=1 Tax=Nitrospina gracilis TaxID=35801 RepID=UPI001F37CB1D|nr:MULTISPECIES: hypothetical protein [Nitrospina]MCF8723336.1 hypothetical protein [Nitrospina sp. Nb-3]